MKAKLKTGINGAPNMVVDVRSLDYEFVSGYLPGSYEKIKVPYDDVEFLFDSDWEKSIVKYREILNISLPKGVSPRFYAAIAYALEEFARDEITNICILRDTKEKARRSYWYKRIVAVINNSRPIIITANGREYSNMYDINIEDTDAKSLAFECKEEICRLKKVINVGTEQLKLYEKALYILENPVEKPRKAIEGK